MSRPKLWRKIAGSRRLKAEGSIIIDGQEVTREEAREIAGVKIIERVKRLACNHNFSYNKITVRDQKTIWGSCSRQKNLSFNWRLILLIPELLDYVICHELAHLRHPNHSNDFWSEVRRICPSCDKSRRGLKNIRIQ
ncbi:MAG: M48 family metallopeptidase [Patescibacteria group bacterium]